MGNTLHNIHMNKLKNIYYKQECKHKNTLNKDKFSLNKALRYLTKILQWSLVWYLSLSQKFSDLSNDLLVSQKFSWSLKGSLCSLFLFFFFFFFNLLAGSLGGFIVGIFLKRGASIYRQAWELFQANNYPH
jgi:hypothetical protein